VKHSGRSRDDVSEDAAAAAAIERLATEAARQEELTEQFKSANAVLQNSLAYFPVLSARLAAADRSGPAAAAVSSLAAAMMRLTLDTSPAVLREVADLQTLGPLPLAASPTSEMSRPGGSWKRRACSGTDHAPPSARPRGVLVLRALPCPTGDDLVDLGPALQTGVGGVVTGVVDRILAPDQLQQACPMLRVGAAGQQVNVIVGAARLARNRCRWAGCC
jgi:hypothetical protein